MKKLIISGSSKLQERAAYWRGYFEGRGYEIIDYPGQITSGDHLAENLSDVFVSFFQNIDRADVFFLMNEDYKDIGGYIGPSAFSELTYAIIANLNRGKKIEINLLQTPSDEQACSEEINFWLQQGWISIYDRPTGKKAAIPVPSAPVEEITDEVESEIEPDPTPAVVPAPTTPLPHPSFLKKSPHTTERSLNLLTTKKRCLRQLTPMMREYLHTLCPEFPAWLLKYIAAPEIQRLSGVTPYCGIDQSGIYNFANSHTIFDHSIGVALITWRFTHDKRQTLAALFHDIASPAFKHCIDFLNGDYETQESTEERTSEIIRNSRSIMRQLKRDGILAGEISDCRLFPIVDNDIPGLSADRLEYTLSNGYFTYETWTLDQVKRFIDDITILKNENDIDELGFRDLTTCKEFVLGSLTLFEEYRSDNCRTIMQFIADIIKSMELRDYLTLDDLYTMSEREVVDWILSCGDKTLTEAFRQLQRATCVYSSNTIKKDRYCVSVKTKTRYIIPLVQGDSEVGPSRIVDLSRHTARAIKKYLDAKSSKYVGFDFEFTPYSE